MAAPKLIHGWFHWIIFKAIYVCRARAINREIPFFIATRPELITNCALWTVFYFIFIILMLHMRWICVLLYLMMEIDIYGCNNCTWWCLFYFLVFLVSSSPCGDGQASDFVIKVRFGIFKKNFIQRIMKKNIFEIVK